MDQIETTLPARITEILRVMPSHEEMNAGYIETEKALIKKYQVRRASAVAPPPAARSR